MKIIAKHVGAYQEVGVSADWLLRLLAPELAFSHD
jgi:hypothetical protein